MNRFISFYFLALALIFIFVLCFFIPIFSDSNLITNYISSNNPYLNINSSNLLWPTPGFTTITSGFGYRKRPTAGASTYHGGIDIAAPTRNKYYCV